MVKELTLNLAEGIDDGTFLERTAARGIICHKGKYLVILGKYGDCKFPGGGMEQGESLQDTLLREVREETGFHVIPEAIREGYLVHEKRKGEPEDILIMDSYYYFCDVERTSGEQELDDYEAEYGYEVHWLSLEEMIARNEHIQDYSKVPWAVRENLVMKELFTRKQVENGL